MIASVSSFGQRLDWRVEVEELCEINETKFSLIKLASTKDCKQSIQRSIPIPKPKSKCTGKKLLVSAV